MDVQRALHERARAGRACLSGRTACLHIYMLEYGVGVSEGSACSVDLALSGRWATRLRRVAATAPRTFPALPSARILQLHASILRSKKISFGGTSGAHRMTGVSAGGRERALDPCQMEPKPRQFLS